MFIDFREFPRDQVVSTDVCIIGAGAAGISLAQALQGSGLDVCLLESGGLTPDIQASELARTERVIGSYGTQGCRLRYFGGSTNHWGGNNMPLAPLDFEVRPWVPWSGWPIRHSELTEWYVEANMVLNAGVYAYRREDMLDSNWPFPELDLQLLQDVYWRLTPEPTTFASSRIESFRAAPGLRVFLHATATCLHATANGHHVEAVTVRHAGGNSIRLQARAFVVAAGAMESSRLLLASTDVMPAGLGNEHDCVGRYFMMHPHLDIGIAADLSEEMVALFDRHRHRGAEVIAGISPSDTSQRGHEILNGAIMLQRLPDADSGYQALLNIRAELTRRYNAWRFGADTSLSDEFGGWVWRALTDIDSVIAGLWQRSRDKSYTGPATAGAARIYLQSEQAPNPDSRITLGTQKDALDVPRLIVDCQVLPIDKKTLRVTGELLAREMGRLNAGRVRLEDWLYDDAVDWQRRIWGGCHHMGTARMSDDPSQGVVNRDCRLHSVDNTYVASSAVFSTGGHANPTLTIVALALRLASHLRQELA